MKDLYLARWTLFIDTLTTSYNKKIPFNESSYIADIQTFEYNWCFNNNTFPTQPSGDPIQLASAFYNVYAPIVSSRYLKAVFFLLSCIMVFTYFSDDAPMLPTALFIVIVFVCCFFVFTLLRRDRCLALYLPFCSIYNCCGLGANARHKRIVAG